MRKDLEILRNVYLEALEEIADYSPALQEELAKDTFWQQFNVMVLDIDNPGKTTNDFLVEYNPKHLPHYQAHFANLRTEYIADLAIALCAGDANPTTDLLLRNADAGFAAELSFQKDMSAAIRLAARAVIKDELSASIDAEGLDLPDTDITHAFSLLNKDKEHDALRAKMKEWDAAEQTIDEPETKKKKRWRAIPFLFMKLAAAAAVSTIGTVAVVKVYDTMKAEKTVRTLMPATHDTSGIAIETISTPGQDTKQDTAEHTPQTPPPAPHSTTGKTAATTHQKDLSPVSSASTHKAPRIVLQGNTLDVATNAIITGAVITLKDDSGVIQTVVAKDGNFQFTLRLDRDFTLTGKKDNYTSAQLSFSTKDVKETDKDDVIDAVLRFSKNK